jgi:hypothetical protein
MHSNLPLVCLQVPCDFAPTDNAGPVGLPQDFDPSEESGGSTDGIGGDLGEPYGGSTLSASNMATEHNGSITEGCAHLWNALAH